MSGRLVEWKLDLVAVQRDYLLAVERLGQARDDGSDSCRVWRVIQRPLALLRQLAPPEAALFELSGDGRLREASVHVFDLLQCEELLVCLLYCLLQRE